MRTDRADALRFTATLSPALRRLWWGFRSSRSVRRAVLTRLVALVVVGAVTWSTHRQIDTASALRQRWEPTRRVLVTTRDVPLGEDLDEHNTELVDRPLAHLPEGALGARPAPRRATAPLVRGEVVTATRVSGRSNVAAGAPDGHAALAIAAQAPTPRIEPGDHVELLAAAVLPAELDGHSEPARTVCDEAVVLAAPEPQDGGLAVVAVAVPRGDVAEVAGAALEGPLAIVVSAAPG